MKAQLKQGKKMIKFEYHSKEQEFIAFNQRTINGKNLYEFLGSMSINDLDENHLVLNGPVARSRYGALLYQTAAMFAETEGKYLCFPRDGDVRDSAVMPLQKIHDNVGGDFDSKITMKEVAECHNDDIYEFTDEEESPVFFNGYAIEASEVFLNNYTKLDSKKESEIPKELLEEWFDYFYTAYSLDSNKFIDTIAPVSKPIDFTDYLAIKPKTEEQEVKEKKSKRNKNKP